MKTKHNPVRRNALACLALFALALIVAACNPTTTQPPIAPPTMEAGQPTPLPAVQATAVPSQPTQPPPAQPTTAGQPATPAIPTTPGARYDSPFGKIAGATEYNSARMRYYGGNVNADGSKTVEVTILSEFVQNPRADHSIMKDSKGTTVLEYITIGDKTWVWNAAMGWQEAPAGSYGLEKSEGAIQDPGKEIAKNLGKDSIVKLVGIETVNGIRCKHYTYSGQVTVGPIIFNVKGEVWIADQSDLPPGPMRWSEVRTPLIPPGTPMPTEIRTEFSDMEVYDLNAPISIKPPK